MLQVASVHRSILTCVVSATIWISSYSSAAASTLFSDNFARTTGLGSNWKVWWGSFTTDGTYAISGPATPSGNGNWASVEASIPTSDYSVQADLLVPSGSEYSGIFARSTSASDILQGDFYDAQISTAGSVNLYKRHAGAWNLLQSVAANIQEIRSRVVDRG